MKITVAAEALGVSTRTIQRRMQELAPDLPRGKGDTVPDYVLSELGLLQASQEGAIVVPAPAPIPAPKKSSKQFSLVEVLPVLPLPMLGLAAAYGVYFFASHFVPVVVAAAEAFAFELTYIGLASMQGLPERQQEKARRVSVGAVGVSVLYNTLAGVMHMRPDTVSQLSGLAMWAVAVLHGAPLAVLAFFVSDLIFHRR